MSGMKRSTAIGRLGDIGAGLDRAKQWPGVSGTAGYLYGALLDGDDDLEYVSIKLPMSWRWRAAEWPVWNHQIPYSACFWSSDGGHVRLVR